MCGIVLSPDLDKTREGCIQTIYRGRDSNKIVKVAGLYLGFNRLSIVTVAGLAGQQPYEHDQAATVFNGEIYNYKDLYIGMTTDDDKCEPTFVSEVAVIDALIRRSRRHFFRYLDGYYAIVRVCEKTKTVLVSRDLIGVMPLYFQTKPYFMVASEKKVLDNPREVLPGYTLIFDLKGKILDQYVFDPYSLHMEDMDLDHLDYLFTKAVTKRVEHSEEPVTIALSGGLDSSMVLWKAYQVRKDIRAVTVSYDPSSDEVRNSQRVCKLLGVEHTVIALSEQRIRDWWESMLFHLEDPEANPIKRAAMIRNYFTAMYSKGKVILCGEGADEIGGGYPPHLQRQGIALEWKCLSTLRSMHAINLDRVNKGGMAWTKEFRVPFLDRALVLYMMGCKKSYNKNYFKTLALRWGVPEEIVFRKKYSSEEDSLRALVAKLSQ